MLTARQEKIYKTKNFLALVVSLLRDILWNRSRPPYKILAIVHIRFKILSETTRESDYMTAREGESSIGSGQHHYGYQNFRVILSIPWPWPARETRTVEVILD